MRLTLALVSLTWTLARGYDIDHHQHIDRQERRAVINVGPSIACTCPAVTVQLQPVLFTDYVPETTVIYPFPGGEPLHVTEAPTYISLTSTVTTRITSCPATGVPSSTPSPVTSSTNSASTASSQLFIGQGLPQGSVNNLDNADFIFLAYRNARTPGPLVKRDHEDIRRQATYSTSAVRAVDLAQPTGTSANIGQDNCDNATPLLLRDGRLINYSNAVAKQLRETPAILGFLSPQPVNEINATFSLTDGILSWAAADFQTNAVFYICGDLIYATWNTPVDPSCTPIVVGAIAGNACVQRVQQTRAPNPAFVAPIPSSTTTPVASSSPSASSPSSSLGLSTSSTAGGASSTTASTGNSISPTSQSSANSTPSSSLSASSTFSASISTSAATIILSSSSLAASSSSSSSTSQSPTFSSPCLQGTYNLFSQSFGRFATPNPAAAFTYALFDGTDNTNALTVAFVFNSTTRACQLNLAGSARTAGIQTTNPNPAAALFLFIDNTQLGDTSQGAGSYYPMTCTTNAALQLSCFVTAFPNLNSLQVQLNTAPQNYLAILPAGTFSNYSPANVVLIPVV